MSKKIEMKDIEELMEIMNTIGEFKNKMVAKNNNHSEVNNLIKTFLDCYLELIYGK